MAFESMLDNLRQANADRLIQTARSANALAKLATGKNRRMFYGVKTRAIDQLIGRMRILTSVGDLSLDGDVIVGVRFAHVAFHVKFSQLSKESQSIVIANLTAALTAPHAVQSTANRKFSEQAFEYLTDLADTNDTGSVGPQRLQLQQQQTVGSH